MFVDTVNQAAKTTEKAKEEAMKLLKSGAISFDNTSDRHVFKRKTKEFENVEADDPPGLFFLCLAWVSVVKNKKPNLYDSFVYGEKMNPTIAPSSNRLPYEPSPIDAHSRVPLGPSLGFDDQNPCNAANSHKIQTAGQYSNREDHSNRKQGALTIYISCNDITEAIIREILEPFGPIVNIRLDERKWWVIFYLFLPIYFT